jgi:hypothetical protein
MLALLVAVVAMAGPGMTADLNRQAIIFNEKTPGVFYCPQVYVMVTQTDRQTCVGGWFFSDVILSLCILKLLYNYISDTFFS